MLNDVNLIGHVGKDLVKKATKEGKAIVEFSLATYKGSGEHKKTEWHQCVCFGKTAEILGQYAKKGSKLFVNGSITYRKYKPEWAQKEVTVTNIFVEKFQLLDAKESEQTDLKQETLQQQQTFMPMDADEIPF